MYYCLFVAATHFIRPGKLAILAFRTKTNKVNKRMCSWSSQEERSLDACVLSWRVTEMDVMTFIYSRNLFSLGLWYGFFNLTHTTGGCHGTM